MRMQAAVTALLLLLLLLLAATAWAAADPGALPFGSSELVRIPLLHRDELDVYARVRVGDAALDVVIDTGSSDSWVSLDPSDAPQTLGTGNGFSIYYGGGRVVTGAARRVALLVETAALGGALAVPPAWLGVAARDAEIRAEIRADGVLGLGMEALQQPWAAVRPGEEAPPAAGRRPLLLSLLAAARRPGDRGADARALVFSVFIGAGAACADSQLVLGGVDPALARCGAPWRVLPIVALAPGGGGGFGFWAVRLRGVSLGGRPLLTTELSRAGGSGRAVLDSGASLVLLPPAAFRRAAAALARALGGRFRCSARGCGCARCSAREFPDLAVSLGGGAGGAEDGALVLRGRDYVRCGRRQRGDCALLVDADAHAPEDRVVLGAVFLRAFYTAFDYAGKRVALARSASRGGDEGGDGDEDDGDGEGWRAVATALAVVAWSVCCISLASAWAAPAPPRRWTQERGQGREDEGRKVPPR